MKNPTGFLSLGVLFLALAVFVGGCGSPPPPPAPTYSVGGTLSGLASGQQLVLQNNNADDLTLSADGPFTFAAKLADGAAYSVTVKTPPPGQTCTVTNGSGTLSGADVSNVEVSCADSGSLDAGFADNGVLIYDSGKSDVAHGLALTSGGKILVAGAISNGSNYDMALWRYDASGAPDNTFGSDPNTNFVTYSSGHGSDLAFAIALDAGGRILLTGKTYGGSSYDMALWRYDANGAPDNTFGSDPGTNLVTYDGGGVDFAQGLALDASGNILVAGRVNNGVNYDMALWRYDASGAPDNAFGSDPGSNIVTYDGGHGNDYGLALALDSSGGIFVTGAVANDSNADMALWRYDASGAPDNTFGSDPNTNLVTYDGGGVDLAQALALDAGGNILLAGRVNSGTDSYVALWRYAPTGAPDTSFGSDGSSNLVTYDSSSYSYAMALALDAGGRILVAGSSLVGSYVYMAAWRYGPDGDPDDSFGSGANDNRIFYGREHGADYATAVALDAAGKILVAGNSVGGASNLDAVVLRYNP